MYKSSYLFVSWVGLFLDISLLLKETRIIHILNCLSVIIHVNLFSTWVLRTVVLALQRQGLSQTCLFFNQISFISLFGIDSLKVIAVCYLFRVARSPVTVQFLDRLTCDVFVIQGSELGMEGDVTVFRTNSGGYVVIPVGKRGWELLGVKVTEKHCHL